MDGFRPFRISILLLLFLLLLMVVSSGVSGQGKTTDYFVYFPLITRPEPIVDNVSEPLLIDGEEGRIYAIAKVDGIWETVVLATADGHYLDSYPYTGRLALDRNHGRLLIDQGEDGLVVLDSLTGQFLTSIDVSDSGPPPADPQVDPISGLAYSFRGNKVYTLDIPSQVVTGTKTLDVPFVHCGKPSGTASISSSLYDPISNTLYLSFLTRACTPHFGFTIHLYDPATWQDWGEYDTTSRYQAVPFTGNLYGMDFDSILGTHAYWALDRTEVWYREAGGGGLVGLAGNVVDWARGLLYESYWGYEQATSGTIVKKFRVSDTEDRQILANVTSDQPPILNGRLAGHDPHTDMLYFLDQGELFVVPTTSVLPVGNLPVN
jgi:hypothetical protein